MEDIFEFLMVFDYSHTREANSKKKLFLKLRVMNFYYFHYVSLSCGLKQKLFLIKMFMNTASRKTIAKPK